MRKANGLYEWLVLYASKNGGIRGGSSQSTTTDRCCPLCSGSGKRQTIADSARNGTGRNSSARQGPAQGGEENFAYDRQPDRSTYLLERLQRA